MRILTVLRKSQYELMFRKWGFRKNMKKKDWQAIGKMYNKRQDADTKVIYNGKEICPRKLKKELRRYSHNSVVEYPSQAISLRVDSNQSLPNVGLIQNSQSNLISAAEWGVVANFAGKSA